MTTPACICGHSWAWHDPRCLACACGAWRAVAYRVDYPSRGGPQTVIRDMQTDSQQSAEQRAKELRAGGYEAVAYRVTIHEQGSAA